MPEKLGAYFEPSANEIRFSVFSKNASRIALYVYHAPLEYDEVLSKLLVREGERWRITLALSEIQNVGLNANWLYYGYRAWGPNWEYRDEWVKGSEIGFISDVDVHGNRFNPNKLLIDPYTREISHDPQVDRLYIDPTAYMGDYYGGKDFRKLDTGRIAPKSIVLLGETPVDYGSKPRRALKDDVIYEVNLRGLTMLDPEIPFAERGTYLGAGRKAKYLKDLGITAVEFLPLQEFADDQNDDNDPRGDNYWGYMTNNYFAPNRRYAADKSPGGPTREFKTMVRAFHDQGIKVYLDVVYNHTGDGILRRKVECAKSETHEDIESVIREGEVSRDDDGLQDYQAACLLSLIGLDNQSYFFLRGSNQRYEGRGGCGGNLNYDHAVVRNLILDSLHYWVDEMGVDGFRFDLAPILSLTQVDGTCRPEINSPFFDEISQSLPARRIDFERGVDLIAEPWGDESAIDWSSKFPDTWAVWNKTYRDVLKTVINKYGVFGIRNVDFAKVLSGSQAFVGKHPWCSINYLVSHDDCNSLHNLFCYNTYQHLTEGVRKSDQISWDQGGDPEAQRKAVRNAFTLLMMSAGVPMFCGGDEIFRAIPPYEPGVGRMNLVFVDQPEMYLDFFNYYLGQELQQRGDRAGYEWLVTSRDDLYIFAFVRQLIQFRHQHEALRPDRFYSGKVDPINGLPDIAWYREDGNPMSVTDMEKPGVFISYRINAHAETKTEAGEQVVSIYLGYNMSSANLTLTLPPNLSGKKWYRVLDTDNTDGWMTRMRNFDLERTLLGREYQLHERSILVMIEK